MMEQIELLAILTVFQVVAVFMVWRLSHLAGKVLDVYKLKDEAARETLSLTISQLVGALKAATPEEAVASAVGAAHDHAALRQMYEGSAIKDALAEQKADKETSPTLQVEGVGPVDLLAFDERDLNRTEG
jgi:hypothetical protein